MLDNIYTVTQSGFQLR